MVLAGGTGASGENKPHAALVQMSARSTWMEAGNWSYPPPRRPIYPGPVDYGVPACPASDTCRAAVMIPFSKMVLIKPRRL